MNISFEKVIIHNFLSYGHTEINLKDKGYCLVSGINNNPLDNALSNGAGKSTWSSAICWALTGQTIQGISSNIKNINIDENSCYVELYFYIDKDYYTIKRCKEPKSDLKIFINNEEKSGKGIRESEAILNQYLPDLSSNLIASIIILGQGLPCKFTSNSPSGRKEVLEKLSKSDFMIQDIKERLNKVINENNTSLRETEDALLTIETKSKMLKTEFESNDLKLKELKKPQNFDSNILKIENNIDDINKSIVQANRQLSEAENEITLLDKELNTILNDKNNLIQSENNEFNNFKNEYLSRKNILTTDFNTKNNELNSEMNVNKNNLSIEFNKNKSLFDIDILKLEKEIKELKSIKDICPTCGQKLPNIVKPDTSIQETKLLELKNSLVNLTESYNLNLKNTNSKYVTLQTELKNNYNVSITNLDLKYTECLKEHNLILNQIEDKYSDTINKLNQNIKIKKDVKSNLNLEIKKNEATLIILTNELNKIKLNKETYEQKINEIQNLLLSIDNNIKKLDEEKLYYINKKSDISVKIEIDNKINTLIKRDFRGFLLSNVINFIDNKCKEYCEIIFGNNNLEFILNGNNIEISYLGKSFENLSGGEKQKVDLIIQFSIRDMMSQYLDFSSNILILDEIFDQLDSLGCTNLLNLISNKLNDIESTFIISHRSNELAIPYDCEMVIVKDENGISRVR